MSRPHTYTYAWQLARYIAGDSWLLGPAVRLTHADQPLLAPVLLGTALAPRPKTPRRLRKVALRPLRLVKVERPKRLGPRVDLLALRGDDLEDGVIRAWQRSWARHPLPAPRPHNNAVEGSRTVVGRPVLARRHHFLPALL